MQDNTCTCTWVVISQSLHLAVTSSYRSASTIPVNNFYLAEPQQMISLTPQKQQKQVAGKTLKCIDKECNPKKARFAQKIPGNKLQKKHFTKMQKHVGLASTKKLTKQDGTHMTICSQITIPTSIFPTTHTTISPAYIPPIFNHTHYTTHSNYNTFS